MCLDKCLCVTCLIYIHFNLLWCLSAPKVDLWGFNLSSNKQAESLMSHFRQNTVRAETCNCFKRKELLLMSFSQTILVRSLILLTIKILMLKNKCIWRSVEFLKVEHVLQVFFPKTWPLSYKVMRLWGPGRRRELSPNLSLCWRHPENKTVTRCIYTG